MQIGPDGQPQYFPVASADEAQNVEQEEEQQVADDQQNLDENEEAQAEEAQDGEQQQIDNQYMFQVLQQPGIEGQVSNLAEDLSTEQIIELLQMNNSVTNYQDTDQEGSLPEQGLPENVQVQL